MINTKPHHYLRRQFLVKAGVATTGAISLMGLVSCGGNNSVAMPPLNDSDIPSIGNSTGSTESNFAGADWAQGGTVSATESFPPASPFNSATDTVCQVTKSYTLGPCYFNPDEYRQDISEGELGVPMIIALKVVDSSCNPVVGADVDIWHCNREGIYSADSAGSSDAKQFSTAFCSGNDSAALASRWFRGVQVTNSEGIVYFKSCFPGWYPSRTVHIHFKIVHNGVQSLVSQFCFEDGLSNQIYLNHPEYTGKVMDTSNANDNVFGTDYADYQFAVKKTADNAMLAYKVIQLS